MRMLGGGRRAGIPDTTLDELLEDACRKYSVALEDLRSASRRRSITRVRAWVAQQAVAKHVASIAALARCFERDESTVRAMLRVAVDAECPGSPCRRDAEG
jgi:chromosomal replication initiation ATPase DnaA